MNFEEFLLNESINDKGILKAIFVVGIPGAGKSYTLSKLQGKISPKVINTDIAVEYISKKIKVESTLENWKSIFSDKSKTITKKILNNYLDSMLPLFIDGTSSDASNILARAGLLESLGYDVGMIFVNTDLETAQKRAVERANKIGRHVPEDFIKSVYEKSQDNKEYFKSKFSFFKEINNSDGELTDSVLMDAYKKVQSFYEADIVNPIGKRNIESIKSSSEKYLIPSIITKEALSNKVEAWYR